ncbi:MAG: endonuclease NucS domain-containing protein [candidate division WOR-3 bacterium]
MKLITVDNYKAISLDDITLSEKEIKDFVEKYPDLLLEEKVLIIARQHYVESGKILDLLGIDENGNCVVIELKKDIPDREVTSQVEDYMTYISEKTGNDLEEIFEDYKSLPHSEYKLLRNEFKKYFNTQSVPPFNQSVRAILIGKEMSEELRKKIDFLNKRGMKIDFQRLRFFKQNNKYFILTESLTPTSVSLRKSATQKFLYNEFFEKVESALREKLPRDYKNFNTDPADTWNRIFWAEGSHRNADYFLGVGVGKRSTYIYCVSGRPSESVLGKWIKNNLMRLRKRFGANLEFVPHKDYCEIDKVVYPSKKINELSNKEFNELINILYKWIRYLKPKFDKLLK